MRAAVGNEITDESLKSPSMLKSQIGGTGKAGSNKLVANRSPSLEASTAGPQATNPFRFIEAALNEAKAKIEKMKNTPQILESLPDVSGVVPSRFTAVRGGLG